MAGYVHLWSQHLGVRSLWVHGQPGYIASFRPAREILCHFGGIFAFQKQFLPFCPLCWLQLLTSSSPGTGPVWSKPICCFWGWTLSHASPNCQPSFSFVLSYNLHRQFSGWAFSPSHWEPMGSTVHGVRVYLKPYFQTQSLQVTLVSILSPSGLWES